MQAWTIRRGTLAPQAAGVIHTDFERTFIRAEVIPFDDYVACGGEAGARSAGKLRVEGRDYVDARRRRRALPRGRLSARGAAARRRGVLEPLQRGPEDGVFTDGSCEGNPGPGGWGFVWVEDDEIVAQRRGHDPATTNNRMELTALIEAFRALPRDAAVTVYSDSELCVKTVNEWARRLGAARLAPQDGPDQEPRAGAGALRREAKRHPKVTLRWIRAHDGSRWNEYADALAESAVTL